MMAIFFSKGMQGLPAQLLQMGFAQHAHQPPKSVGLVRGLTATITLQWTHVNVSSSSGPRPSA